MAVDDDEAAHVAVLAEHVGTDNDFVIAMCVVVVVVMTVAMVTRDVTGAA